MIVRRRSICVPTAHHNSILDYFWTSFSRLRLFRSPVRIRSGLTNCSTVVCMHLPCLKYCLYSLWQQCNQGKTFFDVICDIRVRFCIVVLCVMVMRQPKLTTDAVVELPVCRQHCCVHMLLHWLCKCCKFSSYPLLSDLPSCETSWWTVMLWSSLPHNYSRHLVMWSRDARIPCRCYCSVCLVMSALVYLLHSKITSAKLTVLLTKSMPKVVEVCPKFTCKMPLCWLSDSDHILLNWKSLDDLERPICIPLQKRCTFQSWTVDLLLIKRIPSVNYSFCKKALPLIVSAMIFG